MQLFYTLRRGDTIFLLARRWDITPESLIAANNLVPPYTIFVGQQLAVPPGNNIIRVKAGQSIYSIANTYGIPPAAIILANALQPPYVIFVDQLLTVPPGVPYYVVQPGDSLFGIAARFNVVTNGVNRYDLIQQANNLASTLLLPGMKLVIPYAPPGGAGLIAFTAVAGSGADIWLYHPQSGQKSILVSGLAVRETVPFWSPEGSRIAFVGNNGTVYIVKVSDHRLSQVDSGADGNFLAWSRDSSKLVYLKAGSIMVYDLQSNSAISLVRPGAADPQLFPNPIYLLYGVENKLIRERFIGVGMVSLIHQAEGPIHDIRLAPNGSFALYTTPG
ncbi:MAG TPA: LysM peptidoglycan-binding domain-containing protein, partial [Bacillota bacterium]|nr:LysM peptidoglycan-binding domain-containing protein [Bacillota bacterium]